MQRLSPVASPTSTLLPDSSSSVLTNLPFDPREFFDPPSQEDPQSGRTFIAPSFESAVPPSGKSTLRTKS
ncbi:uncharacterized protein IAS62_005288 [Cryptococcus decagattii]|uniref:Uncharacterized protein n=1 Tax=Cryptococcus decagattii TaxID=1859122 RepID=A0ABZ2AZH0_9TREE